MYRIFIVEDDAVIVLDPVNRKVIDRKLGV